MICVDYVDCRVPEDCHGNSDWICNHGIYRVLCETDSYPNQQHHRVSIFAFCGTAEMFLIIILGPDSQTLS